MGPKPLQTTGRHVLELAIVRHDAPGFVAAVASGVFRGKGVAQPRAGISSMIVWACSRRSVNDSAPLTEDWNFVH